MSHRAYALLTVKAIDDEARVITGIATTPSTDRMGDIVESAGAEFTLPLPLLFQHDAHAPIGHVTRATVTPEGIAITAKIFKVPEAGLLQAELDKAWQSIKYSLVRGLSIGFRPIEWSLLEDGGVRFLKWAWLELSAVTIPANQDATIATVKRLTLGPPARDPLTRSAAADPLRRKSAMKNYSDRIAEFQRDRTPKAARMAALMDAADGEGRTLTEAEATEYDTVAAEVKTLDTHIARLEALEGSSAAAARPLVASGAARPQVSLGAPTLPPGIEFARYVISVAAARGNPSAALDIAKARYPDNPRVHTLLKAAVAGGTTADPTWAGPLVQAQTLTSEFVEFLRPMTIVGKFGAGNVPSLRRVPFNVRITGQTSGGQGYWVGQGKAKPLTRFDFNAVSLYWAKVASISVISDELVRFSSPSAEQLVRDGLAAALTARLDVDFVDPDKAAVPLVSPASIINGLNALTPSGTDAAAVRADVKQLFEAFIAASISPTAGVFIMPQTLALALSLMLNPLGQREFPDITMNGGTFFGLPVITSQYAAFGSPTGNLCILVNASDVFLSDDGGIAIDASREASLEMDSEPASAIAAGSPLEPVPAELVSMFQTNSVALRAERMINWQRRRDDAVQWLDNVQWGTGSPT